MEEKESNIKPPKVDVEKIFREKSPRLARFIPRFVYNYIKRTIRQKDANELFSKIYQYHGLDYINGGLDVLNVKSKVIGRENIPDSGRFIFVANHPLGGLDGSVFAREIGKIFPEIRFPVNDILLNVKNFEPVFVPINKHGKQSFKHVRKIEDSYKSDAQILYFPAGLCSRRTRGVICDLEWKKNFISKAIQHKRDVIPVYINGHNSNFFYRVANIRKFFGIKANIEMFYLPNEMFNQKGKTITLVIGKPIPFSTFDKSKSHQEWASSIKEKVYSLNQ